MRTALLALLAVAGGTAVGTGFHTQNKGTAEDMVVLDMSNVTPGVHHVGLSAPDEGRLVHLEWTTHTAGSGAGDALYDVIRESDQSILCTATVPCTSPLGSHLHIECGAEILNGEHLDVEARVPGCALQPAGVLAVTFFWE